MGNFENMHKNVPGRGKKKPLKCFKQNDSNLLMLCFVSEKKKKKKGLIVIMFPALPNI